MNWTTYNNAGAALSQSLTDMPVGTITGYAGATAPSGWLLCDGSAVSRTTYAELFGVVGTTYGAGDASTTFNVPDSSGFIILATSQAARLAAAALPQYVTSLPSSPVDGQTVVYAADATNGVMWTLRYRAASSSSYKWEFVGGSPMAANDGNEVSTASNTYVTLTGGPSFTVPLAGTYVVRIEAAGMLMAASSGGSAQMSAFYDGSSVGYEAQMPAEGNITIDARRKAACSSASVVTLSAASKTLDLRYCRDSISGDGTAYFRERKLFATPVRVG